MKKRLLLCLLSLITLTVWAQQTPKKMPPSKIQPTPLVKKTNPTNSTNNLKPNLTTTKPTIPPKKAVTTKPTTSTKKAAPQKTPPKSGVISKDSVVKVSEDKKIEEKEEPLAVYVADTATLYLKGNLKMGDEYISSRYIPPTITVLLVNDLFDRKEKEMQSDDFMADKLNIGDKFYLNQQSIPTKNKKELLTEIYKNSNSSLLPKLFTSQQQNLIRRDFSWQDTTLGINREKQYFERDKLIKNGAKLKIGKSLSGIHLNTNDTLGKAIQYALLKKDIPALTMKVWCDPKAVLQKSKETFTTNDLANNVDPKKRIVYQELLKQNFILVMGIFNVHEIYENVYGKDSKGRNIVVGRNPTGRYECDVRSFLYKIEMNPMTIDNLAKQCNTKRIPIRYAYRLYFQNFSMGAKVYTVNKNKWVNGTLTTYQETVHVAEKDFMANAIQSATNDIFEQLEKQVDEFKMRSGVMQTTPFFAAEMGVKQGVYVDQRYDIYRYVKNLEKNEVNAEKIAMIRVTKVAKNKIAEKSSTVASKSSPIKTNGLLADAGLKDLKLFNDKPKTTNSDSKVSNTQKNVETTTTLVSQTKTVSATNTKKDSVKLTSDSLHKWSHFKPITMGKIENGDFLLQNDDKGLSLMAGYNTNNLFPAVTIGAELQLSVLLKSKTLPSGIRLGVWLNMITNDYKFTYYDKEAGENKESSSYFTLYLSKDFYLSRVVDVSPFVAFEMAGENRGVRLGSNFPINVYQGRFKLVPNVSFQKLAANGEKSRLCFGIMTKYDF